jgi:DNA-binding transcriptional LysR family regulator
MLNLNLARLDLTSIRLVVLCAQTGSLSAAARESHCTLSAGSQRLSALEQSLGRRLFIRDYRGMQPTDAGQMVVQYGKAILEQVELMHSRVASAGAAGL